MADFPAALSVASLTAATGVQIIGVAIHDLSGFSVASAGDVNGDGIDDVIIGAPVGSFGVGDAYVIFGAAGGLGASIDLAALNGANGFRISGRLADAQTGTSVASAGDVNGDGYDDLIIGAPIADPGGSTDAGESYVLFGSGAGFAASVDLRDLNGSNGFRIQGVSANDYSGRSVASAGDVNGDGLGDFIIGAQKGDNTVGESFVVFGSTAGFPASFNLATLNGSNGFCLAGEDSYDLAGTSVASAGDVNGDGYDDIIVGAPLAELSGYPFNHQSGASYVVFGSGAGFAAKVDLAALDGTDGFRIDGLGQGHFFGESVASAGDINGDGFDDLIVGAPRAGAGASYVVFGSGAAFGASVDLAGLDGSNGFRIDGIDADDNSGHSVASAGDVNGDGFGDIIVGANRAYSTPGVFTTGESYVIFGSAAGFGASFDLASLDGSNGFRIDGANARDESGTSVAAAGDVNGDGFDDLIVGAPRAEPDNSRYNAGETYIIYGRAPTAGVTRTGSSADQTIRGGDFDDVLAGGGGNDLIIGGGGADSMAGGTGDDTYEVDDIGDTVAESAGEGNDRVDSFVSFTIGAGIETLALVGSGQLDGTGNSEANLIIGNNAANILIGGGGNDVLRGLAGGDDMRGEAGDDVYEVDEAADTVTENAAEGIDRVESSVGFTLAANFENLTLTGTAAINGTGNSGANVIIGNNAANTLNGAGGADVMEGGDGDDVYLVLGGGATVTEASSTGGTDRVESYVSFTLGDNLENLTLASTGTAAAGTGNALDNILIGNFQNNTLDGAAGADTMEGGGGNDIYFVDDLGDIVGEAAAAGTDEVRSLVTYTLTANIEQLLLQGSAAIDGSGNALANILNGNSAANRLDGGAGDDDMQGFAGDDTYVVDSAGDTVLEDTGTGTDTVESSVNFILGADLENLTLTGTAAINGTGNSGANVIIGNDAANTLNGAGGADVMDGQGGDDVYLVLAGGGTVSETSDTGGTDRVESYVSFTLSANIENLTLASTGTAAAATGNALDNVIIGNFQNNSLNGAAGADAMDGGGGNDLYIVDDAGDVAAETSSAGGTDLVQSSADHILGANIENLTLTGTAASATGNALSNVLTGNGEANAIDGQAGGDTMAGKAGNDSYVVDHNDDIVDESDDAFGYDSVQSSVDYIMAANVERLILTGSAVSGTGNGLANAIWGNAGANTLTGGDGNDVLDGDAGADAMLGGVGNDVYEVDQAGDTLTENALEGSDHVRSAVSWSLGANFEILELTGTAAIDGTGNAAANTLFGNDAANTLNGGGGGDVLRGRGGNDVYLVLSAADSVVETSGADGVDRVESYVNFTLGDHVENLTLASTGAATLATGNALANILVGNFQNNRLDGAAGADTMEGGGGDDVYVFDDAGDVATETGGSGTDRVETLVSVVLGDNIENLTMLGSAAINGFGNSLANVILGNAAGNNIGGGDGADTLEGGGGNDTLTGGLGADTMLGGLGNDFFEVDDAGDVATESAGEGSDTVRSSVTFAIGADIELLRLSGTGAINGTGNDGVNFLFGNASNNILNGAGGADYMEGGAGDDIYVVDDAGEAVVEAAGEGTDTVETNADFTLGAHVENLTLHGTSDADGTGNALDNRLVGNSGANRLDGLGGADYMEGGDGDDLYVVRQTGEFPNETSSTGGTDTVATFVSTGLGANIENLTMLGSAAINGSGNALANIVRGNSGDNVVDGGAGADSLRGGDGNDTYLVDDAGDQAIEAAGAGTDEVESSVSFALAANIEILQLTGSGDTNAAGNALANILHGNSGANRLDGGAGADEMWGGGGDDTYVVDDSGDVAGDGGGTDLVLSSVDFTLAQGFGIDQLRLRGAALNGTGNELANFISGTAGANRLDGGAGADRLVGGAGNDVYVMDDAADAAVEAGGGGTDRIETTLTRRLGANIENLTLTGFAAVNGFGNALGNDLVGNLAANVLDGGAGADSMAGGAGDDTYVVDDSGDVVAEIAGHGTDLVQSSVGFTLGDDVEQLRLVGTAAIEGAGNALANMIRGNSGANILDGAAGADALAGGGGDDVYIFDDSGDLATEGASAGIDRVQSSVTAALGAHIENLLLTGAGAIDGTGNALANNIRGNAAANRLDGGAGADTLEGGAGDDVYVVDRAGDGVVETAAHGTDTVESSASFVLAAHVENLVLTGTAAIAGTGNALANILSGNAAANRLDGAAGADTMQGGAGNDVYIVSQAGDSVIEASGEGIDRVESRVTATLGANVEHLLLLGAGSINGFGNALANRLVGNAAANRLDGGTGADGMAGGAGDDIYVVDDAGDRLRELAGGGSDAVESSVGFALGDNVEALTLTGAGAIDGAGNSLANILTGNGAANRLDGRAGADTMRGGGGDDTYFVDDAGDQIVEAAAGGADRVESLIGFALGAGLEALVLRGTAAIDGAGNGFDNLLVGNAAANRLDGRAGADTMRGGGGDDSYVVDDGGDRVAEFAAGGDDRVESAVSFALGANLETLMLRGTGAINGAGNELANLIVGNAAGNRLDGGAGADTMRGGGGDDGYIVDDGGDRVLEAAAAGEDEVRSSVDFTLGANLENLTLTGAAAIAGTGNALANILTGNAAANRLDGGAGVDAMRGGAGDDLYVVDDAGDAVAEAAGGGIDRVRSSVSLTLAANVEELALVGSAAIDGAGNALANMIRGNAAANILDGAAGADTLAAGGGDDVYIFDDSGDVATEGASAGIDRVQSSVTAALGAHIENLLLTGGAAIDGTGNALANTIRGNAAANRLDGGAGADTLEGGDGDDLYVVDRAGDGVVETAAHGSDTVQSSVSYVLAAHVENLVLTGTAANAGTGNALANVIAGNGGANRIDGGAGADGMAGGAGDDTYLVDDSGDVVNEATSEGSDRVLSSVSLTLAANVEELTLAGSAALDGTGNSLANILTGNAAANRLDGGVGADTMRGGGGDDVYVVHAAGDRAVELSGAGVDRVESAVGIVLGANLEQLTLTGAGAIGGSGNGLANQLTGNGASNRLDGRAGADMMRGGGGDDVYVVDNDGDVADEAAAEGVDRVESSVAFVLGADLENLTLTGAGDIAGTGNALANSIAGNGGANRIDGGVGADRMAGGAGDDTYLVDDRGDAVTEAASEGSDRVLSSVSLALAANVEELVLAGSAALDGTGNALGNLMTGNEAANRLDGRAGADTMRGGDGDDIYVVDDQGDAAEEAATAGIDRVEASVDFALGANLENLTLTGSAAIAGTGNALANILTGNAGANRLDGGAGADSLRGGGGDDVYLVDAAGDRALESSGAGIDRVESSVTFALGANVENLVLTGADATDGTGNALANELTGNAATNRLDGRAGADTMRGGGGDDVYVADDAGDLAEEGAAGGTDRVESSVAFALGANIEYLALTGAAAIDGAGNALANVITGNRSANRIDGGAGADSMAGGAGNDVYVVDEAGDQVQEEAAAGVDRVLTSVSLVLAAQVEELVLTGAGAKDGTGNALANILSGNAAANRLDGGAGGDTLSGGDGRDTYVVDDRRDRVIEAAGGGADRVESGISLVLADHVEGLLLTGAARNGTGNALANDLTGNDAGNRLDGAAGADRMAGGLGDDLYVVDHRGDAVIEADGAGADRVHAAVSYALAAGADVETLSTASAAGLAAIDLTGNALANSLIGNAGANRLDGGGGADILSGLGGGDVYAVDDAGDRIVEGAGGGGDLVLASVSYRLGGNAEVETLRAAAGTDAIDLTGNGFANELIGNDGANRLDGAGGADRMEGRGGDDFYVVDARGDRVVEGRSGGIDMVLSRVSFVLGAGVEHLVLAGAAASGIGNGIANDIAGNNAGNLLDGRGGADRLAGGRGDDVYIVDHAGDAVAERAAEGADVVRSSVSYALSSSLESLALTGAASIAGTGNALDNLITGNEGANRIDGGAGADLMRGGAGDDVYAADDVGDRTVELAGGGIDRVESAVMHVLAANIETLTLTGGGDIDGSGNELANLILGNDGANRLDGRGGADTMRGGGGDDVYVIDEAGDRALELAGGGRDRVETALDHTLGAGLEDLNLGGAAVAGTGNALANFILGNGADNRLDGRAGADRLAGGGGDDLYIVDDAGDSVDESGGEGSDGVEASVSYALGANVEALVLVGRGAIDGVGNELANTITGNAAANRLDGAAGADRMIGGAGDDTYLVEAFEDEIVEGASGGVDTVLSSGSYRLAGWVERLVLVGEATDGIGNALDNEIIGNDGINVLDGGAGDDRLVGGGGLDIMKGGEGGDRLDGGEGRDLLTGGAGADRFLFGAAIDGVVNIDDLTDFAAGEDSLHLDRAVFVGIAADGALAPDAFHVGSEAADAGDRLIYNQVSGEIFYDADGTGEAAAILFARVEAGTILTHLDFAAYSLG